MDSIRLIELRSEVASAFDYWRGRLLSADDFAKLAKSMGLGWFTKEDVLGLWAIGLLRADLVSSEAEIPSQRLLSVEIDDGGLLHSYCDIGTIAHRQQGYGSAFCEDQFEIKGQVPKFHPHKLLVLYHVKRTLRVETSSTQYLHCEDGVQTVVARQLESCRRWTSSIEFGQRFDYWNAVAEIAAVAEPISYNVVHAGSKPPTIPSPCQSEFEQRVRALMLHLGKPAIQRMREELAFNAEELDGNSFLHVLLRLMKLTCPHLPYQSFGESPGLQGNFVGGLGLM